MWYASFLLFFVLFLTCSRCTPSLSVQEVLQFPDSFRLVKCIEWSAGRFYLMHLVLNTVGCFWDLVRWLLTWINAFGSGKLETLYQTFLVSV